MKFTGIFKDVRIPWPALPWTCSCGKVVESYALMMATVEQKRQLARNRQAGGKWGPTVRMAVSTPQDFGEATFLCFTCDTLETRKTK